ncbi:MAG: hypothetical protein ACRDRJ_49010, partial [Streptosporangiaceae bacterium]
EQERGGAEGEEQAVLEAGGAAAARLRGRGRGAVGLLDELNRSGFTIVVITHDQKVAAHAGRMIAISDGVLAELTRAEQAGADRG